jgi:hypothetical protein
MTHPALAAPTAARDPRLACTATEESIARKYSMRGIAAADLMG